MDIGLHVVAILLVGLAIGDAAGRLAEVALEWFKQRRRQRER